MLAGWHQPLQGLLGLTPNAVVEAGTESAVAWDLTLFLCSKLFRGFVQVLVRICDRYTVPCR
jgi:hypothetical protein